MSTSIPMLSSTFYLVVKRRRGYSQLSGRLTLRPPALAKGEIAIQLNTTLPRALFETPQLRANVVIPGDLVTQPVVDAAVLDNVQELLTKKLGMRVAVEMVTEADMNTTTSATTPEITNITNVNKKR